MKGSRSKLHLHASGPKYRRRQRAFLNHLARVRKLAERRSPKACAPSPTL